MIVLIDKVIILINSIINFLTLLEINDIDFYLPANQQ